MRENIRSGFDISSFSKNGSFVDIELKNGINFCTNINDDISEEDLLIKVFHFDDDGDEDEWDYFHSEESFETIWQDIINKNTVVYIYYIKPEAIIARCGCGSHGVFRSSFGVNICFGE